MTATLVYERFHTPNCLFPIDQLQSTFRKSYYKFYQLKLRQLLTENRSDEEENGKYSQDSRRKRLPKEYMNHFQDKRKLPSQTEDYGKRTNYRRAKESEPRPKSILKSKQSSS